MKKRWKVLLILVVIVSFGISLSYPVKYRLEEKRTEDSMERLVAMRDAGRAKEGARQEESEAESMAAEAGKEGAEETEPLAESEWPEDTAPSDMRGAPEEKQEAEEEQGAQEAQGAQGAESMSADQASAAANEGQANQSNETTATEAVEPVDAGAPAEPAAPGEAANPVERQAPTELAAPGENANPVERQAPAEFAAPGENANPAEAEASAEPVAPEASVEPTPTPLYEPTPEPTRTPKPTVYVDRFARSGAETYEQKEKRTLDVDKILPQFQEIYAENQDFAGWITIPNTAVDYPVVQSDDSDYYLHHDFFGEKNANGQIILDTKCDPYTPSYNLVISGHSMRSGKMFGRLVNYMNESYWEDHKLVYFDTLMDERTYVVFAAFFSADYDVDETGFRYNADIQYSVDARQWLREVKENELYDTGIDVEFGDEFLTLTTCNKAKRSDGRFVVVCRRLREGESIV